MQLLDEGGGGGGGGGWEFGALDLDVVVCFDIYSSSWLGVECVERGKYQMKILFPLFYLTKRIIDLFIY